MEFLPTVPPVPSGQVAALDGDIVPEPANAAGSYDETFMAELMGRRGSTPLALPTLSGIEGGEMLPLDTDAPGNVLPVELTVANVERVVPTSPLLSSPHTNRATAEALNEMPTRTGEARHLPPTRVSVPLATYDQTAPPLVLDRQLPSNPQAAMSSLTVLPAPLQMPLLPEGRFARQETGDASPGVVSSRVETATQSLLAHNGMGALLGLSANPSNSAFASEQIVHPFNQPGWGQAFGEKVLWLVNNHVRQAELRLNPPDLGPLEVRIAVDRDQASIVFTSQHALVRDAVEATIPRLREMMVASGFTEVDVNVGQHGLRSQDQRAGRPDAAQPASWMANDDPQVEQVSAHLLETQIGLVDLYV